MKLLREWIKTHQIEWGVFASFLGFTVTDMLWRKEIGWPITHSVVFLISLWAYLPFRLQQFQSKRNLGIGLALLMASTPSLSASELEQNPPPERNGLIIGVTVAVGGTFVICSLYKACKRLFKTNAPPVVTPPLPAGGQSPAPAGDENTYAMSVTYQTSSHCYEAIFTPASDTPLEPKLIDIGIWVLDSTNGTEVHIVNPRIVPPNECVNLTQYKEYLNSVGLSSEVEITGQTFSVNGVSSNAQSVPISFEERNKVFIVKGDTQSIPFTVQRSPNLSEWEDIVNLSIPSGRYVVFNDETISREMFYRIKPQ